MARPVVYDDVLRRRLLDVTADRVAERGANAVSLRELANAADTSTTAVYSLFGGKAGLLAAVIMDGFESLGVAQEAAEPGGATAMAKAYRSWALAHPRLYRMMFSAMTRESGYELGPTDLPAAMEPLHRWITAAVPEHFTEEEIARETVAAWAQVHGIVSIELSGLVPPVVSAEDVFHSVIASIAAGLRVLSPELPPPPYPR